MTFYKSAVTAAELRMATSELTVSAHERGENPTCGSDDRDRIIQTRDLRDQFVAFHLYSNKLLFTQFFTAWTVTGGACKLFLVVSIIVAIKAILARENVNSH